MQSEQTQGWRVGQAIDGLMDGGARHDRKEGDV
jgi:hypothetical protein